MRTETNAYGIFHQANPGNPLSDVAKNSCFYIMITLFQSFKMPALDSRAYWGDERFQHKQAMSSLSVQVSNQMNIVSKEPIAELWFSNKHTKTLRILPSLEKPSSLMYLLKEKSFSNSTTNALWRPRIKTSKRGLVPSVKLEKISWSKAMAEFTWPFDSRAHWDEYEQFQHKVK